MVWISFLSKSCRKSRKSRPLFLSNCGGNIGKTHSRRSVNQCCFHIRPGVSLHPSLAAPFLFSPGVSIFVHFYQVVVTAVTAVTHGTAVTVGTVSGAHNPISVLLLLLLPYINRNRERAPSGGGGNQCIHQMVFYTHFAAIRCFVRKSEKSPDIITILFPILLRDTVRTCPNCSDIVTTLQIKCLIHFVRKKCVSTK